MQAVFAFIALCVMIIAYGYPAFSQDQDRARVYYPDTSIYHAQTLYSDSSKVDKLTVSAQRFDKFKPSVTIINSSEYKGLQKDLPAVLEQESGVTIQRSGATGEYSTASMRGDPASRVKVFLDGMPLNSASDGVVDLSKIPLDIINKIELYQGVVPFDLAEDGMGNVINLSTETNKDILSANAEYGSFDYKNIGIMAGKKIGISRQTLSLDFVNAQNNYPFISTFTPYGDQPFITKNNNDFTNFASTYNASYNIQNYKIKTEGMYQNFSKGIYIPYNPDPDSFHMRNNGYKACGIVKIEKTNASNSVFGVEGKARYQADSYQTPKELNLLMPEKSIDKTLFSQVKAYSLWTVNQAISVGIYSLLNREKYFPVNNGSTDFFAERYRFSVSLSTEFLPVSCVRVKGQYLFSQQTDTSSGVFRQGIIATNAKNGEASFHVGQMEIQWDASSWINVFASGYIDKKEPTFYDKFGKGTMFFGNPNLAPEKRWQSTLGASSIVKNLKNSLSLFYGETQDKIIATMQSQGIFIPRNYANVKHYGAEWAFNLRVFSLLEFDNSVTFMENEFYKMPTTALNGNLVPFIPEVKENARISFSYKNIFVNHSVLISTPYYFDINNTNSNVRHNGILLSASIGYKTFFGTTFTYRIENYLDTHNEDYYDNPRPGRAHYISAVFNLSNLQKKKE